MQAEQIQRLKVRFRRCDFTGTGPAADWVEDERLRKALECLTVAQRLVWEMRYCGITRTLVKGGLVEEVYGERLPGEVTGALLGADTTVVHNLTMRGGARLLDVL